MRCFRAQDPVWVDFRGETVDGHLAHFHNGRWHVVLADGREVKATEHALSLRKDVPAKRVYTSQERLKMSYFVGDSVRFRSRDKAPLSGKIVNMNKTKAEVLVDDARIWQVAYAGLEHENGAGIGQSNFRKLIDIGKLADRIIDQHLQAWRFRFDDAVAHAGQCIFTRKEITMSLQFCQKAPDSEIMDTVLHEVAHALVGPEHHHDAVWKAAAVRIGCTGDRCTSFKIATPKLIVSCRQCGWHMGRNRRSRSAVCKTCREPVAYELYTPKLWAEHERRSQTRS